MTLETIDSSEKTAREVLLDRNPDILFGVYELKEHHDGILRLELIQNVLCLYANQLANIQGYDPNGNITLLDINELRKGNVKLLSGQVVSLSNPILLSGGVIEIYGAKTRDGTRDHVLLTLREGGVTDGLQYTSIAGRNIGKNITEEAEREQAEESPFLLKDAGGRYALGLRKVDPDFIRTVENAIEQWKKKIIGAGGKPDKYDEKERAEAFMRKLFPEIHSLAKMVIILDDIVARKAYVAYEAESLETYPGVEDSIRTLKIDGYTGKFYVFHDTANNTLEYRKLERIKQIPTGYKLAGRNTSKLYLESLNQRPNTISHNNPTKKLVPTIQAFVGKTLRY